MVTQNEFDIPLSNDQRQIDDAKDYKMMMIEGKAGQTYHNNGKQGEQLVKSSIRKLKRYFKENINIIVKYRTNKLSMFFPAKDKDSSFTWIHLSFPRGA